jgi:hypothetical protein
MLFKTSRGAAFFAAGATDPSAKTNSLSGAAPGAWSWGNRSRIREMVPASRTRAAQEAHKATRARRGHTARGGEAGRGG